MTESINTRPRATTADLRRENLASVISLLHRVGPLRRMEITEATGLNKSTVLSLVEELEALELVTEQAALTEPMAVGIHAVAKAQPTARDAVLVVGCGPVGLAVIAGLKLEGIGPIVASDFSPKRRALAETLGADVVVDPGAEDVSKVFAKAAGSKQALLFECVGVPGVIDQVMRDAPRGARIVVAGVCMEADRIRPMFGIHKELSIQFVLGYTPEEFERSLHALAEGAIPGEALVTGKVDIDGVAGAFETLGDPEAHAKILVEP